MSSKESRLKQLQRELVAAREREGLLRVVLVTVAEMDRAQREGKQLVVCGDHGEEFVPCGPICDVAYKVLAMLPKMEEDTPRQQGV